MRLALLLLPLAACAPEPTGLEGFEVASARLSDVTLATFAVVGGVVSGDAVLEFETPDGDALAVPVELDGGTLGAVVEATGAIHFDIPVELDLSAVEGPVEANDLLGTYDGTGMGAVLVAGVDGHDLTNRAGVVFDRGFFAMGFAIFGGFEWIDVNVDEDGED